MNDGTGRVVRSLGARGPIAGKTGTTNNGADVWFIGYTPTVIAGFWFGYDIPRPISSDASGGRLAAPAWADFYLNGWSEPSPSGAWRPPPGMKAVTIDARTGYLANTWCPITQTEYFKPGTEPTHPCPVHTAPPPPVDSTNPLQQIPNAVQKGVEGLGHFLKRVFKL